MSGSMDSLIDLYDSDSITINRVAARIREYVGTQRNPESLAREIQERFYDAGFKVRVYVEEEDDTQGGKTYYPAITIIDRVEPEEEFDHEKMGHEVRSNILGVKGQDNVQKAQVPGAFGGEKRTESGLILPN